MFTSSIRLEKTSYDITINIEYVCSASTASFVIVLSNIGSLAKI